MSEDSIRAELEEISAEYRGGLPARFARLEALRSGLAAGTTPAARIADLRRELHSLAGSAKTFGFPALTDAARAAEAFLDPYCDEGKGPDPGGWARIRELLVALERAVQDADASRPQ
jgi:HPt (histidine-containing phosphotransfer) domain-containing protein